MFKNNIFNVSVDTKKWVKAAGIRALKTMGQTAAASLTTASFMSDVNWVAVGSATLLAGIFSVITSVAGIPEVKESEVK